MNNAFTREELINVLRGWHKNFKRVGRSHERNVQALAEAADMLGQGKWISVKDRLPELEQKVLVYAVGKEDGFEDSAEIALSMRYLFHIFSWDKGVEEWHAPWAYFNKNYSVTHWMPLPEPPEEES